jgi:hypothetical protein
MGCCGPTQRTAGCQDGAVFPTLYEQPNKLKANAARTARDESSSRRHDEGKGREKHGTRVSSLFEVKIGKKTLLFNDFLCKFSQNRMNFMWR